MGPLGIFLLILTKMVEAEVWKLSSGNIVAGAGYSSDKQQIVAQTCYNATVSSISAQQGYVQLDTAQSFSNLEDILGISVTVSGKFSAFSAEAKARYMRSVQDKDYSISLNYYQYATSNVAVKLAGYGEEALTETGRHAYNGGKNPYFGLLCGDYFIASYQEGALLTMGLNIQFSSAKAKKEFVAKAGASFGDIVSASASVQSVVAEYRMSGSVTIQAFQMGGQPSQLAKVLNKDSSGQYYALGCSLSAMGKCIAAAGGLLDYARNKFSEQFSTENNTGLTPLGVAFTEFVPIKYVGLVSPASLVTPEVLQCRNELFSQLMEYEYYQEKLYPFFNKGYPVELDASFMKNANSLLSKASRNVAILMQPHGGAADCFNYPEKCQSIKADISSQLQNITTKDLKFLEVMRYALTAEGGVFYNTGGNESGYVHNWHLAPDESIYVPVLKNCRATFGTYYYYEIYVELKSYHEYFIREFVTERILDGGTVYEGTLYIYTDNTYKDRWIQKVNKSETKQISPFFFEAYKIAE